jgi:hypothetical protein
MALLLEQKVAEIKNGCIIYSNKTGKRKSLREKVLIDQTMIKVPEKLRTLEKLILEERERVVRAYLYGNGLTPPSSCFVTPSGYSVAVPQHRIAPPRTAKSPSPVPLQRRLPQPPLSLPQPTAPPRQFWPVPPFVIKSQYFYFFILVIVYKYNKIYVIENKEETKND